jgi:hypothetical protein
LWIYPFIDDTSRRENMAAFLKVLKNKFGGAEQYLIKDCGFTKEEVDRLREILIVDSV